MALIESPSQFFNTISHELYAVAYRSGLEIPKPATHMYIAGAIYRFNKPRSSYASFIVNSLDELESKGRTVSGEPNAFCHLICQHSGDFFINFKSLGNKPLDKTLPERFYAYASMFSARVGRTMECDIYYDLHTNTLSHMKLLRLYHTCTQNGGIQPLPSEINAFQRHISQLIHNEDEWKRFLKQSELINPN